MNSPKHIGVTLSVLRGLSGGDTNALSLEGVSWDRLVAFSSSHFVLQALADPLEACKSGIAAAAQGWNFLAAIQEANAERNATLLRSVCEITHALGDIGVVACALKGAAFLVTADAPSAPAPWRFMSDIDLLVPEERLAASVAVLGKLGFAPAHLDYDPAVEAHFPPLVSPCGTFSVELHTRLFGLNDFGLAPLDVLAGASPVRINQAEILVPALSHRIAHVLIHAQLHNRNHAVHRIVLKDVLDLIMLDRQAFPPVDWQALLSSLGGADRREAAMALLAVWQRLGGATLDADISPAARVWAEVALTRLQWPRWRTKLSLPVDALRLEAYRLRCEKGHLGRRLRLLTDPVRAREVYASWSGKQRQRVWG